jgi:hypothetical protein
MAGLKFPPNEGWTLGMRFKKKYTIFLTPPNLALLVGMRRGSAACLFPMA